MLAGRHLNGKSGGIVVLRCNAVSKERNDALVVFAVRLHVAVAG